MARRKKKKPGRNRAKALKPKFGVSPWAHKPREVSRQAFLRERRKKFAFLPLSKAFLDSEAIRRKGVKGISRDEKKDFLKRHMRIAAKANEFEGNPASKIYRIISNNKAFDKIEGNLLDKWAAKTHNAIEIATIANSGKKIEKHLLAYFRSRKIPVKTRFEKDTLRVTVNMLIAEKKITDLTEPLNLPLIEQYYLRYKRAFRGIDQENAVKRNSLFGEIFGGERLTANQRRAAKRWMLANYPKLEEEKNKIRKKMFAGIKWMPDAKLFAKLFEGYDRVEKRFKQRAIDEILKTFRKERKKTALPMMKKTQAAKKGTRKDRMAAYTLREKTSAEKKKSMLKEKQMALVENKPFDPAAYALKEIGTENKSTAEFLKKLIDQKLLKENNLAKLFIKGSLVQRMFQKVVEDNEFGKRFGNRNINGLATGLAYIGPEGKLTEKTKKAFQGKKGTQMFAFLEKRGFIDTEHGKRHVTYLARFDDLRTQ